MVKKKLPCPLASTSKPCTPDCTVCYGRGTVREWNLVLEVDFAPPGVPRNLEQLGVLPVGLTIDSMSNGRDCSVIVVSVLRHKLTEAMAVACDFFDDANGEIPFVRKAW